jgi:signal transduction histidine kinase
MVQLLETGRCPTLEQEYVRKDGKLVPILMARVALHAAPEPRFLCFIIDLTERKRLEEQFRQAQKLESIGQLAGGVAHDFNNLLTIISGYAFTVLSDLPVQHPVYESIEEISKAASRAADLTRQLLTFSRNEVVEPKNIVLNDTIRNFDRMLRRLIGEDIELILHLDPEVGEIRADPGHIEQVIMNLAVNARDAMPTGGKLIIETSRVFVDEQFPRMHPSIATGSYVMLTVSDTGTGMSPEVQSHLFEPFFTTKKQGKGTGLGLSTVYGIVKQSGGSIWVYSELGQGSTFKIFLPLIDVTDEAAQERVPPAPPQVRRAVGVETILVAEDEPGVRRFIRQTLESNGYTVLESSSGREAVDLAREHSGQISLLLTDVVMPEMGGAELADEFALIRPGAPVLCMSGYTDRFWRQPRVAASYIQKPFTSAALLCQIRALLDPRSKQDQ